MVEGTPVVNASEIRTRPAVRALTCPRCGGAPDPGTGPGRLARCSSCGVLGRIEDEAGQQRLVAMPAIDEEFAAGATARHEEGETGGGTFHLHGCELIFAPYWRVESLLGGFLAGQRQRTRRVLEHYMLENGQKVYQWEDRDDGMEDVSKEVQRSQLAVISACPLEEYGLPTLDRRRQSPGALGVGRPLGRLGVVRVFHGGLRRQGTVLDPLVQRSQALLEVQELLERQREGMVAGLSAAQLETVVLDQDICLLFYPAYLVHFQSSSGRATAAVDGVTGHVVAVRRPPARSTIHDRRLLGLASVAAGVVSAALARLALLPPPIIADSAAAGFRVQLLGAAVVLGGAALWGLKTLATSFERRRR